MPIVVITLALFAAAPEPTFDVPSGFARADDRIWSGSSAFLPLVGEGTSPRELLGVWIEAQGQGSLALGRVLRPLDLDGQTRAEVGSAVASHFRSELGMEVTVERAEIVGGMRAPRIELRVRASEGADARIVRLGLFPQGEAYYVLTAIYPPEREPALGPAISQAFESFELDRPPPRADGSNQILKALALLVFTVLVGIGIRLRRRPGRS